MLTVQFQMISLLCSSGLMVSSVCWNDSSNMIAAMQDNRFVVWYYPAVVYADKDLLQRTLLTKEGRCVCVCVQYLYIYIYIHACSDFSKAPQLLQFIGNYCTLRRSDGALITTR